MSLTMSNPDVRLSNSDDDMTALASFVNHLRDRAVRTYVGDVPLPSGKSVPINISFDRETTTKKPRREFEE